MTLLLSDDEIAVRLGDSCSWSLTGKALNKKYSFSSFREAIGFVNKVADLAESINHHPDIIINFRSVVLYTWTHSAGGVTEKDFQLLTLIDRDEL